MVHPKSLSNPSEQEIRHVFPCRVFIYRLSFEWLTAKLICATQVDFKAKNDLADLTC